MATCGGSLHLSCKQGQITGGLPHLSGLLHLPGVPHLHVNRPLIRAHGRYIISVVISRILRVAAIVKKGKTTPVTSRYYQPNHLLRDLFLLLIKILHSLFHPFQPLFLSPVVHRLKKPVKPGLYSAIQNSTV